MSHTHDMPIANCISCGRVLDSATALDTENQPEPGDVSFCLHCGHVMVFGDDMIPREPNAAEAYDIAGNPVLLAAQRARALAEALKDKDDDDETT